MEKSALEKNETCSNTNPLRKNARRHASIIDTMDDDKRNNIIRTLRRSSTNMINVSTKKYDPNEVVIKEYLKNENFEIESKDKGFEHYYIEKSTIGEGSSSVVKRCVEVKTNKEFAVKLMRTTDSELLQLAKNEFYNLKFLNSRLIIKAYELFYNPSNGRINIVMEYAKNLDNITKLIKKNGPFKELIAIKIFKLLIEAILTMHKNGICHRDIKPENILTDLTGDKLKIIDFNISKKQNIIYDKSSKTNMKLVTHIGTLNFSAPEIIEGFGEYSEQVDMWSAGAILYFMLSGEPPFLGDNLRDHMENIAKGAVRMEGGIWDTLSDSSKDMIINLLQVNPKIRLSAYQAMKHKWLNTTPNIHPLNFKHPYSTKNYNTENISSPINIYDEQNTNSISNGNYQTNSTNYYSQNENTENKFRSKSNGTKWSLFKEEII